MLSLLPAMMPDVLVGAARFLKGICKDSQTCGVKLSRRKGTLFVRGGREAVRATMGKLSLERFVAAQNL
jgi:hypothetical protein